LDQKLNHCFLCCHFFFNLSMLTQSSPLAMAASHPHPFQPLVTDESEIYKLVASYFLPDREVLQWRPAADEDIPTPNTNEIMVFTSFFQYRFGLLVCDFIRDLLDQYRIELIHLNPNSILQIIVFVHLCEAYLGIAPNFPLFKNYFFLKYKPSTANQKSHRCRRPTDSTSCWFS
jgi:hypothetical protein